FAGATQRRNARSQDANQEEGRPAPAPRNAYAPPLTLTQRSGSGRERAAEPTAGEERSTRRTHGGALQFGGDGSKPGATDGAATGTANRGGTAGRRGRRTGGGRGRGGPAEGPRRARQGGPLTAPGALATV